MRSAKSVLFAAPMAALLAAGFAVATPDAARAELRVITSVKPVHALVAGVMEGVGTPDLLLEGAASPHTYALKPSQARALSEADVVFWIGETLESFLVKPVETIAEGARAVSLMEAPGLVTYPVREGGTFEGHDHGDHDEHGHDDHGHDDHGHDEHAHDDHDHDHDHDEHAHDDHDHGHDEHKHDEHAHDDHKHDEHAKDEHDDHGHDDHDEHAHGEFDAHFWLDPVNGKAMVRAIESALSAAGMIATVSGLILGLACLFGPKRHPVQQGAVEP